MITKKHPYLFLTDSILNHVKAKPPVIVVGLPRSGSSFLSDILSQLDEWYVFDDLYLYREAKAIGADQGYLTDKQVDQLLFFLSWQIRARLKFGTFSVPDMTMDDVDNMEKALRELYRNVQVTWSELLEEWMLRLAYNQGATNWGYKAPQDFLHMKVLNRAFPGAKYIFIQRDPRTMMRSLKYVNDNDGNPKQYHPVAYSLYWKSCADKMEMMRNENTDFLVINFESLIAKTQLIADIIAEYLCSPKPHDLDIRKPNTSFSHKKKSELTSTEIWLIEKIVGKSLAANGYINSESRPEFMGFIEIVRVSIVFSIYQLHRMYKRKSSLVSIKSMLKNSLKLGTE